MPESLDDIITSELGFRDVMLRFVGGGVPGLFKETPPNVTSAVRQGISSRISNLEKQFSTPEGIVSTVAGPAIGGAGGLREVGNLLGGNVTRAVQKGIMLRKVPGQPGSYTPETVQKFGPLLSRFKKPAVNVPKKKVSPTRQILRRPKGKGGGQFRGSRMI
jgi:hypothetical protein